MGFGGLGFRKDMSGPLSGLGGRCHREHVAV